MILDAQKSNKRKSSYAHGRIITDEGQKFIEDDSSESLIRAQPVSQGRLVCHSNLPASSLA